MDELGRSGRIDHGNIGMVTNDIFRRYGYVTNNNRGHPARTWDGICSIMRDGIGMSCQDIVDGSGERAPGGRATGGTTTRESQS